MRCGGVARTPATYLYRFKFKCEADEHPGCRLDAPRLGRARFFPRGMVGKKVAGHLKPPALGLAHDRRFFGPYGPWDAKTKTACALESRSKIVYRPWVLSRHGQTPATGARLGRKAAHRAEVYQHVGPRLQLGPRTGLWFSAPALSPTAPDKNARLMWPGKSPPAQAWRA